MSRSTKKFIYGVFYLLFFALIFWEIFGGIFKSAESCFDKVQNQGETGVDCGGPCTACEIAQLNPLRASSPVVLGLGSGRAVLLAEVSNPNSDYGASPFSYNLRIYDQSNRVLQTIHGSDSIYGSERKYLYEAGVQSEFEKIARAEIEFTDIHWVPLKETLRPVLVLPQRPQTEVTSSSIRVSGTVTNKSSLRAEGVKIIAILYSRFGNVLFVSQTVVGNGNIDALEGSQFVVSFLFDEDLAGKIDPEGTEVFVSSR